MSAPGGMLRRTRRVEYRRIQMDLPICRYSELGAKLDSTSVHLWTLEHLRFTLVGVGFLE